MKIITRGDPPSPLYKTRCTFCKTEFHFYECEAVEVPRKNEPSPLNVKCPVCTHICTGGVAL